MPETIGDDPCILFGTDEPVPPALPLRAGPLSLCWQGSRLLHLCASGVEVWHAVTWPYRDPDWCTPEPVLHPVRHEAGAGGFTLSLRGHYPTVPRIALGIEVRGSARGGLCVAFEAVPEDDVPANRIGLCLLHPASAGGAAAEVEHDDGRLSRSTLPRLIPPWPPFTLVRGIRHEYAPGLWGRCVFEGATFEFEDQRNNGDDSFKTYARSNSMPRPYRLRGGQAVRQRLRLSLDPAPPRRRPVPRAVPLVVQTGRRRPMPGIGLAVTGADAVAPLRPAVLHLCPGPGAIDWPGVAQLLAGCGAALRLDLECGPNNMAAHGAAAAAAGVRPRAVAVFPSLDEAVAAARAAFPGARIGVGTPHFFVQLSRAEALGGGDFLSFTTASTVHGADDASVMHGLRSLPAMLETLRARDGRPVQVGPNGIGARRSPLGQQPETDGTRRVALAADDPRTRGLFGAAWLLGHVAALAEAGAEAVTPASLRSLLSPGGVRHPAWFVFERLCGATARLDAAVSQPGRVAALAPVHGRKRSLLLANLGGEPAEVSAPGWTGARVMDAGTWPAVQAGGWAAVPPGAGPLVRLGAYAVALLAPEGGDP